MRLLDIIRSRQRTIRWSLLRNIILLIVLLSGLILITTFVARHRAMRIVSRSMIEHATDNTELELQRFFEPVVWAARIIQEWARLGLLDTEDVRQLNALLMPVLQRIPQITSAMRSGLNGDEFLLLQLPDRWVNRFSRPDAWGHRTHWYEWTDAETMVKEYEKDLDYDSRKRPWHQGAVRLWKAADEATTQAPIHWTEPYIFFTTKDPGITASLVVENKKQGHYVIGLDILLIDISRFTSALTPSPGGLAFVLTEDGRVIGLPRNERFRTAEGRKAAVFSPAKDLNITEVGEAVQAWRASGNTNNKPFRFKSGGRRWWAGFRRFQLNAERSFAIGVLVPENDFLTELIQQQIVIGLISFGFLIVAVATAVFMSRRYSVPLEQLVTRSDRIRELDLRKQAPIDSPLVEVQQLADAQERMRSTLESFERYVPTEVVRELVHRGEAAQLGGRTETVTCLFTDVRGFTPIAETMTPEELTAHMGEYFDGMIETLRRGGATIDKLIGDAIFAFWGAPIPDPEHAKHAVAGVLDCRNRLQEFNRKATETGLPPLPTHFGMSAGPVMVGNVGSHSRLNYTAIGDVVNVASRLERVNILYGTEVLVTDTVREGAGDSFVWRRIDRVRVKGKTAAVEIYEPIGPRDEVPKATLKFVSTYEGALFLYQAGEFDAAIEAMGTLYSQDPSVRRLIGRCREYSKNLPPDGWSGVSEFDFK